MSDTVHLRIPRSKFVAAGGSGGGGCVCVEGGRWGGVRACVRVCVRVCVCVCVCVEGVIKAKMYAF